MWKLQLTEREEESACEAEGEACTSTCADPSCYLLTSGINASRAKSELIQSVQTDFKPLRAFFFLQKGDEGLSMA